MKPQPFQCLKHYRSYANINRNIPQEWKESNIVPIHKKGDRMDCNNYRGISLLSN